MKIGIIGDVHFGASTSLGKNHIKLGMNTRLVDYGNTLEATIDMMIARNVTHLIFTGDIFEHRQPTVAQQKLFSKMLHYAISSGILAIYIVIGNHDQQRMSNTTTLSYLQELNLPNIHVYDDLSLVEIKDDDGVAVNCIFLPYRDRKWFGVVSYNEAIEKIRTQVAFHVNDIDNSSPTILVGHMTIEGTLFGEEDLEFYGENQLSLPTSIFENIDKTFMGHIHTPGRISEDPYIFYVGSMEKRGGFESHDKVFVVLDTDDLGVTVVKEPCREIYDIKLDYSNGAVGEAFNSFVKRDMARFAQDHELEGSIVRVRLMMSSEDSSYCDTKQLEQYLINEHAVHYCVRIVPGLYSSRQARDERITEKVSDSEAFLFFIENTIDDPDFRREVASSGLELMRSLNS